MTARGGIVIANIVTIQGTVKSLQPIMHGADTPDEGVAAQGNERFHRKMKVWYEGSPVQVPVISGNSIRGTIRRLGAESYWRMLDLDPSQINRKLKYLLDAGGALQAGAESRKKGRTAAVAPTIASLREHIPLVSLMGGSFQRQIIQGKLSVDFLIPQVDETAELLGLPKPGIRAADITEWLFYTRQDHTEDMDTERNQMIYRMEYIVPGILFTHSFTLIGANEVEMALFYHLLDQLNQYSRIGGRAAQGHGKVQFNYSLNEDHSPDPYFRYIESNKPSIREFLDFHWKGGNGEV